LVRLKRMANFNLVVDQARQKVKESIRNVFPEQLLVRRKRKAGNPGGKPKMVKTFTKRKKRK
jgi:hypothetical protein